MEICKGEKIIKEDNNGGTRQHENKSSQNWSKIDNNICMVNSGKTWESNRSYRDEVHEEGSGKNKYSIE